MSDFKSQLVKRRPKKVSIDGDDFYILSMTIAEAAKVDSLSLDPELAKGIVGFSLSRCLVDENGVRILESETDPLIQDIPIETALGLLQEIRNATNPPPVEIAKKN